MAGGPVTCIMKPQQYHWGDIGTTVCWLNTGTGPERPGLTVICARAPSLTFLEIGSLATLNLMTGTPDPTMLSVIVLCSFDRTHQLAVLAVGSTRHVEVALIQVVGMSVWSQC